MRNTICILLFLQTIIGLHLTSGCIRSERDALLKIKQDLIDPLNRLASWVEDGDCCRWYGVICHNLTGHVLELHLGLSNYESAFGGKLSESLLDLKHLEYLNLSNNNFGGIPIPKFFGSMGSLTHIDLHSAGFGGMIPLELGNLSNLQYLNAPSYNSDSFYAKNLHWLIGLPLKFLDLTSANLSQAFDWLNVINTLPSLEELHFSGCSLPNVSPLPTVNFSSLSVLDLSNNYLLQEPVLDLVQNITSLKSLDLFNIGFNSPIPNWLYSLTHLEHLDLHGNNFQGTISRDIGNLTSLTTLDLAFNNLDGKIPKSFQNLCKLRSMSLWRNKIDQEINEIFDILFPCISNVLELLDLEDCHLSGYIPDYLGKFKNLGLLSISKNSIAGPIPISIGNLESINDIDLSLNNLNGTLPISFGGLSKLGSVDLSHNALDGDVSEIHFENLTNLVKFLASGNKFRLRVSSDWIPPHNLTEADLDGWSIGSEFPRWVKSMNRLDYLNLANSGIDSRIPAWFWDLPFNFYCLNLSHNQIHGVIPEKPSFNGNQLFESFPFVVDLSSNNFQGPLPYIFSNSEGLYLSNNSFSGPLSKFLCHNMHELRNLRVLDIGYNFLSEDMPDCWVKWKSLEFLNLNNNRLSGKISQSIGALTNLRSLHLRNNSLSGEIPLSLGNCTKLHTIDLSENELVGNIPTWIGENFLKLTILSVHTNKFDGVIPEKLCFMMNLHVLDLADNKLSGAIPKCLNNFSTMASDGDSTYMNSEEDSSFSYFGVGTYEWSFFDYMLLGLKGKLDTYSSILKLVRAVDLSRNKLTGEIPEEITSLRKLIYLNLSQNLLTGRIPTKIGDMQSLEVVDFSLNELFGEIPQSLAEMTFLSLLNLSFNNFKGRIPLSTQIQGFSPSSFMGNKELCGAPLSKDCSGDGEIPGTDSTKGGNDSDGDEINWLYVSMPLGFVVGFWFTFGPLVLNRRRRYSYFHFLDNLWDKIWG